MKDWLLALWVVAQFLFDASVLGFTAYVVFWKGRSGWWFLLAMILCSSESLFKVLRKRFGVEG